MKAQRTFAMVPLGLELSSQAGSSVIEQVQNKRGFELAAVEIRRLLVACGTRRERHWLWGITVKYTQLLRQLFIPSKVRFRTVSSSDVERAKSPLWVKGDHGLIEVIERC